MTALARERACPPGTRRKLVWLEPRVGAGLRGPRSTLRAGAEAGGRETESWVEWVTGGDWIYIFKRPVWRLMAEGWLAGS